MARHTNKQVAHLFAHRQAGDSNNMHSDGTTLKSYSTPIAVWHDGVCFISSNGMSATTAGKHLSPLHSAIYRQPHFYTPAFTYYGWTAPSAAACILSAAEEMQESFNKLCRMRTYVTESIERYETRRAEIISMAARFDVANLPDMPEATGDLKEKAKEMAAADRKRKAEAKQREEERTAQKRADDLQQFNDWLQGVPVHFPASYRKHNGTDNLKVSIDGVTVITSQGAEAPLDHVIKALKFYDSRKATHKATCTTCGEVKYHATCDFNKQRCDCGALAFGQIRDEWCYKPEGGRFVPYHTNGHKIHLGAFVLDSIDEAGNVKAGCHTFTAAEIARFRKQWGL